MAKVSVRYIVDDVDAAINFYCGELGFHEDMHPAPSFAMLSLGDLRLVLSAPGGGPGGGQAMPGVGGKQILVEDPAGNPVELFQPTIAEARLDEMP
jgi:catechol 2,3-dioxygenase-like lactoylglutathione lyase family enzyme